MLKSPFYNDQKSHYPAANHGSGQADAPATMNKKYVCHMFNIDCIRVDSVRPVPNTGALDRSETYECNYSSDVLCIPCLLVSLDRPEQSVQFVQLSQSVQLTQFEQFPRSSESLQLVLLSQRTQP